MSPTELRFRVIEKELDQLLVKSRPTFAGNSIAVADESVRSYHYKESYLLWRTRLEKTWELPLQTARVQVRFSCGEPMNANDKSEITISVRAEKFRQGQQSSVDEKTEHTVSFEEVSRWGLDALALKYFKQGADVVGQAL
jgi:hypothetical protein